MGAAAPAATGRRAAAVSGAGKAATAQQRVHPAVAPGQGGAAGLDLKVIGMALAVESYGEYKEAVRLKKEADDNLREKEMKFDDFCRGFGLDRREVAEAFRQQQRRQAQQRQQKQPLQMQQQQRAQQHAKQQQEHE